MYIWHRYKGKKLSEIGARFGVTESALTQASRRMRDKRYNDKKLETLILKIVKKQPF
jgi:transposase